MFWKKKEKSPLLLTREELLDYLNTTDIEWRINTNKHNGSTHSGFLSLWYEYLDLSINIYYTKFHDDTYGLTIYAWMENPPKKLLEYGKYRIYREYKWDNISKPRTDKDPLRLKVLEIAEAHFDLELVGPTEEEIRADIEEEIKIKKKKIKKLNKDIKGLQKKLV